MRNQSFSTSGAAAGQSHSGLPIVTEAEEHGGEPVPMRHRSFSRSGAAALQQQGQQSSASEATETEGEKDNKGSVGMDEETWGIDKAVLAGQQVRD